MASVVENATAKAATKLVPPTLPDALNEEQRNACLALVYMSLKLTLKAKKKVSPEQREKLAATVQKVLDAGAECAAFPLACAVWLRNKKELGNRLISTILLARCVKDERSRLYVRGTAKLVLKLPTDLTEFLTEYDALAEVGATKPCCLKKIAADIVNDLQPYQASKYDSTTKMKRVKTNLRKAQAKLKELQGKAQPQAGRFRGSRGKDENAERDTQKRVDELKATLKKLHTGNLGTLIRHTHASDHPEVMMGILRKRYPESPEEFEMSRLEGEFDESKCGMRMKLEAPSTWEKELSDKGNVPTTWAALLKGKDARGNYTLPYMAMLRNLRNILLMGFTPSFLRKHLFGRLPDKRQIQGSGQTAVSLSHTWSILEKEFDEEKIADMNKEAIDGMKNIIAYKLLLRKIRGPILGTSDKQVGIIGEFLGAPVWEPCGLRRQNECFLQCVQVSLRDGNVLATPGKGKGKGKGKATADLTESKWLPVACNPITSELIAELKQVFDAAIQTAANCAVQPIRFDEPGPVILWYDLSNPKLPSFGADEGDAEPQKEKPKREEPPPFNPMMYGGGMGNRKPPEGVDLRQYLVPCKDQAEKEALACPSVGEDVELDEISTHKRLNLELRYFCGGFMDYNVMGYDRAGLSLWNATWSNTEIKNAAGENVVVHCRDICSNPSPTEPALRTCHIDFDCLDENVFCLMITSQIFSGSTPEGVAVTLRECHNGSAKDLKGNHQPIDDKGKIILAADISEPLKKGGTACYACIHRDPNEPDSWIFRNTMDYSLQCQSQVASQISGVTGAIFRKMFQDAALASTLDANRVGYVRLCQLFQAASAKEDDSKGRGKGKASGYPENQTSSTSTSPSVKICLTGVRKREAKASAMELQLTGEYVEDLDTARASKKRFTAKAVDVDESLELALKAAGGQAPAAVIRVANNSYVPEKALKTARQAAGRAFPYATIDARGHIFDVFDQLPLVEAAVFVPGQVESCVAILRNMLAAPLETSGAGAELMVRYVDSFLEEARKVARTDVAQEK